MALCSVFRLCVVSVSSLCRLPLVSLSSPSRLSLVSISLKVWANNTAMIDMSLTAGDGRTYKWYKGAAPAPFLFGNGMTYTTFETTVSSESNEGASASSPRTTVYTVTVVNVGHVAAAQTVMLFARPVDVPGAPLPMPNRQLFDFARTPTLSPGSSAQLTFEVGPKAVAMVDWAGSKKAYAGKYAIEFSTGGATPDAEQSFTVGATTTISTLPPPPAYPSPIMPYPPRR